MTLPPVPDHWSIELATAERTAAVAAFGFTDRQARFLVTVLLHAGVFLERQYCGFAGIVHGQKSTDFIRTLVARRCATPVSIGKLHRGRLFHVHYKPLWAAIGEPDSRFRKPATQGRLIERVMLLDAVLDDPEYVWLGPAADKRRYCMRRLGSRLALDEYPRLSFGDGPAKTIRYFPDKLPIGIQPHSDPEVFLYLVTCPSPMDFRGFLLRHTALLRIVPRWTLRLLFPRSLRTAQPAYLHAAREHLATPLHPSLVDTLAQHFSGRRTGSPAAPGDTAGPRSRPPREFGAPKFQALYRQWLEDPRDTLWMASSTTIADTVELGLGRIECVPLTRQYLHLSPLIDVA